MRASLHMRSFDPSETPERRQELAEQLTVMRAQLGDRDALFRLFERYNSRLIYYLRRIVRNPSDVEDVLQDVWLAVLQKIATLEQPEAFKSWIYRIAHNRAISRIRKRRPDVSLEDLHQEAVGPAVGPSSGSGREVDENLFAGYDAIDVHAGLERLSSVHREALTLRFLDDLSYQEIAKIVGSSVGTVRSRLHYAKSALHSDLESRSSENLRKEAVQ